MEALCAGKPRLFESTNPVKHASARVLCGRCPLRVSCLQLAHDQIAPQGTWGGELFKPGRVPVVRGIKPPRPQRWRAFMNTDVCNLPGCDEPLPHAPRSQRFYCCRTHRTHDGVRRRGLLLRVA